MSHRLSHFFPHLEGFMFVVKANLHFTTTVFFFYTSLFLLLLLFPNDNVLLNNNTTSRAVLCTSAWSEKHWIMSQKCSQEALKCREPRLFKKSAVITHITHMSIFSLKSCFCVYIKEQDKGYIWPVLEVSSEFFILKQLFPKWMQIVSLYFWLLALLT